MWIGGLWTQNQIVVRARGDRIHFAPLRACLHEYGHALTRHGDTDFGRATSRCFHRGLARLNECRVHCRVWVALLGCGNIIIASVLFMAAGIGSGSLWIASTLPRRVCRTHFDGKCFSPLQPLPAFDGGGRALLALLATPIEYTAARSGQRRWQACVLFASGSRPRCDIHRSFV